MPKEGTMTQLSRPYQVALAAIGLLAAVWFVALRGHSSTSGGGASTPTPQPVTPSSPYHGSAPGVAGLTRAIEKARGAVAQSEANTKQLADKSAHASSPSSSATAAAGSTSGSRATPAAPRSSAHTRTSSGGAGKASGRTSAPSKQALVEAELKQGRTVIVLFWDAKGVGDIAVRRELRALQASSNLGLPRNHRRIVLHEASAGEVGSFGSFTRAVQVYATPTILIISPSGKTSTLTGLTDAYSIRQAISEARRA
jgi:hypothetical protein